MWIISLNSITSGTIFKKSRIKNSNFFLKGMILVSLKIHLNRFKSIFKTLKSIQNFQKRSIQIDLNSIEVRKCTLLINLEQFKIDLQSFYIHPKPFFVSAGFIKTFEV